MMPDLHDRLAFHIVLQEPFGILPLDDLCEEIEGDLFSALEEAPVAKSTAAAALAASLADVATAGAAGHAPRRQRSADGSGVDSDSTQEEEEEEGGTIGGGRQRGGGALARWFARQQRKLAQRGDEGGGGGQPHREWEELRSGGFGGSYSRLAQRRERDAAREREVRSCLVRRNSRNCSC